MRRAATATDIRPQYAAKKAKRGSQPAVVDPGSASNWLCAADVAFKDTILPSAASKHRITRAQLDVQLAARCAAANAAQPLRKLSTGDRPGSQTALQKACMRVLAANITDATVLRPLQELLLPPNLLDRLLVRVSASSFEPDLPFATWIALVKSEALVGTMYRGLVLDDAELRALHSAAVNPPIAILIDLSDTAFVRDFHVLRAATGISLAALRLDGLKHVDDDSIADLARTAKESQLELLSLRDCIRITDRSAPKLSQFPAIRMLGTTSNE